VSAFSGPVKTLAWSGTLGLSQSSPNFVDSHSGNTLNISIDGNGNASLNYVSGSGALLQYFVLQVEPQYTVTGCEASGITVNNYASGTSVRSKSNSIAITGSGSSWAPDPAQPTDSNPVYVELYQGGSF
jgi:hypothetical protein